MTKPPATPDAALAAYPGPWVEKLWGWCRCLYRDEQVEIMEALIDRGGYSSIHKHLWKDNTFQVVSGELEVELYPASLRPDVHRLLPSCSRLECGSLTIQPHVPHRFLARQATRLIETYRAQYDHSIDPNDICRLSEGGVRAG